MTVRVDGMDPTRLSRRKARALLAYLATARNVRASRDVLCGLLWSDSEPERARASLRQSLHWLRRAIDAQLFLADDEAVALAPGALQTDVSSFERLARADFREGLREAVGLYRGEFLEDLRLREEAFTAWQQAQRTRLHGLAAGALARLAEMELDAGDATAAVEVSRRLLALESFSEAGTRLLMRALVACGDRSAALSAYRGLQRRLDEHLGTRPEEATRHLFMSIRVAAPPVDAPARPAAAPAPPIRPTGPERRPLTVMRCRLVRLGVEASRLDVEEYGAALLALRVAATRTIEHHGGCLVQVAVDGLVAQFGYPRAHEDDAERAVRAALEVVTSMASRAGGALPVDVRVGIATGSAMVDSSATATIDGQVPGLAEHLHQRAPTGAVVLCSETERLVRGRFALEPLDSDDSVTAWRVVGERAGVSRFAARAAAQLTPFVGREDELAALHRAWDAARDCRGRAVLLIGDAGIGKSRLVDQLCADAGASAEETVVLQCVAHRESSALWPLIEFLESDLARAAPAGASSRIDDLERHLETLGWHEGHALGALGALLALPLEGRAPGFESMDGRQRREATLAALVEYLRRRAERSPLLVVEDLHWADPSTLELVDRLVAEVEDWPALMVCSSRPGLEVPWKDGAHVRVLAVGILPREDSASLARAASGAHAGLSQELIAAIVARASGNPLHIEELTRAVTSADDLASETVRKIPESLQGSLMARLDAVPAGRRVAQQASALGREFDDVLLDSVWDGPAEELKAGLAALEQSGLLRRSTSAEGARHVFKHALVQDTAYQSMPRSVRARLQARIAKRLEAEPGIADSQPELLARHHEEAGASARAVELWFHAAQRCARQFANPEAISHIERVLALLEAQPSGRERDELELRCQLLLGALHQTRTGWGAPEAETALVAAQTLVDRLGLDESDTRFGLAAGLRRLYNHRGRLEEALDQAAECMRLAEQTGDGVMMRDASYAVGFINAQKGRFTTALARYQRGARYESVEAADGRPAWLSGAASNHAGVTIALWYLGCLDQAHRWCARLLDFHAAITDPFFKAYYVTVPGFLALRMGDLDRLAEHAGRAQSIAREYRLALLDGWSTLMLGWRQSMTGAAQEGVDLIKRGLHLVRESGSFSYHTWILTLLAEAYLQAGNVDAGRATVAEALAYEAETGMRESAAETRRVQGNLLAASDSSNREAAEASFRQAVAIAGEQRALSLELKASMDLGRLLASGGRVGEARALLARVYARFTEGLDTPQLIEAGRLLAQWCKRE